MDRLLEGEERRWEWGIVGGELAVHINIDEKRVRGFPLTCLAFNFP